MRRTLLLLLGLAVALAGCADDAGDSPGGAGDDSSEDAAAANAQAQQLLLAAGQDFPERFSYELTGTNARGDQLVHVRGALDEPAQRRYIDFEAAPAFYETSAGDDIGVGLFGSTFTLYTSPEGSVYLAKDAGVALPPGEPMEELPPALLMTPAAVLADPEELFHTLTMEGINVTSVTPTTHQGQDALEIQFTFPDDDQEGSGTAIVLLDSERLAKIDIQAKARTADEPNLFAATFDYAEEDQPGPGERVQRALALSFSSDSPLWGELPRDENGTATFTWTFLQDGATPTDEVELVAYNATHDGDGFAPPESAVLWRMGLDGAAANQGGVNATFTDADEDGFVSAGDTLRITLAEGVEAPGLALLDKPTGIHMLDTKTVFQAVFMGDMGSS